MITNKSVAEELQGIASSWEQWHVESWGDEDPRMVDVGKDDARDIRHIAELVRRNRLHSAAREAAGLDTIVRDELPDSFFKLLKLNSIEW